MNGLRPYYIELRLQHDGEPLLYSHEDSAWQYGESYRHALVSAYAGRMGPGLWFAAVYPIVSPEDETDEGMERMINELYVRPQTRLFHIRTADDGWILKEAVRDASGKVLPPDDAIMGGGIDEQHAGEVASNAREAMQQAVKQNRRMRSQVAAAAERWREREERERIADFAARCPEVRLRRQEHDPEDVRPLGEIERERVLSDDVVYAFWRNYVLSDPYMMEVAPPRLAPLAVPQD